MATEFAGWTVYELQSITPKDIRQLFAEGEAGLAQLPAAFAKALGSIVRGEPGWAPEAEAVLTRQGTMAVALLERLTKPQA